MVFEKAQVPRQEVVRLPPLLSRAPPVAASSSGYKEEEWLEQWSLVQLVVDDCAVPL